MDLKNRKMLQDICTYVYICIIALHGLIEKRTMYEELPRLSKSRATTIIEFKTLDGPYFAVEIELI